MNRGITTVRFRWLTLLMVCALLIGTIASALNAPSTIAQDEAGESIGDPPIASDFQLAEGSNPGEFSLSAHLSVDTASRASSRDFYASAFQSTVPPVNWTGNFASCAPGTASPAHLQSVLNQIAYYRAMAGVPSELSLGAEYTSKAQQAALMMGAAQLLDHNPGTFWPCYTAGGAEGAANSNLHYRISSGITLPTGDAVTAYMEDAGDNNANAGHRRWLLYPQTTTFGIGAVQAPWDGWDTFANAIWVIDQNLGGPRPATRDGFVAWPPPGYVPYQVVFPRWSFSYPGANFAGATVTATKNGGVGVPVLVESRNVNGYGENTIVWSMEGYSDALDWPRPANDVFYTVVISNVMIGGVATSFTYEVKVFDPATDGAQATVVPSRATVGSKVAFLLAGFPANTPVTATWKRPTGSVDQLAVSSTTDDSGELAGSFTVPNVPGGAGHQIIFTATNGTTASAYIEVAPRIKVTPSLAKRGETVDVSLRGFAKQDTVRIRWRNATGNWIQVADVTTSNSGSANVNVVVPDFAIDGQHVLRAEGSSLNAQTNSVQIQGAITPPTASISPDRTTVNNWVIYAIGDFPPNATVSITWTRLSGGTVDLGTVVVDSNGAATGQFRVPATPGGPNQTITFSAGTVQATASFEVAARIKVNTTPGVPGETVDVSLRGYGKQETVRIRWLNPAGQWIEVAQTTTSNTGSANVPVIVPSWAPDGGNSVRGDGTQFRQQTNAVQIMSPPIMPANEPSPTPATGIVIPTETPNVIDTVDPTPSPAATVTATPTPGETLLATETPIGDGTTEPESGP